MVAQLLCDAHRLLDMVDFGVGWQSIVSRNGELNNCVLLNLAVNQISVTDNLETAYRERNTKTGH